MLGKHLRLACTIQLGLLKAALLALAISSPCLAVDFAITTAPDERRNVVAFSRSESDGNNGPFRIYCTGVVIHPHVVLTAAHCLQEGAIRPGAKDLKKLSQSLRIHFGQGDLSGYVTQNLVKVKRAAIHPSYMRGIRGWSDIGLLILKTPAPISKDDIRPLALDFEILKTELLPTRFLTVAGFGYSEDIKSGLESFGIKRSGEITIQGKTANEILIVGGRVHPGTDKMTVPRDGDSGGPVFYQDRDGQEFLAGVVSRATKHNNGSYGSALSLIRPSICWLESETGFRLRPTSDFDFCHMKAPLHKPGTLHETNFLSLCLKSKSLPTSAQYTLSVLMNKFNEKDCHQLEPKLTPLTNLSLDATFITDIAPLATLHKLERLSIRDNGVLSVAPLKTLRRLQYLDLSYNNIKDLETLAEAESHRVQIIGRDRQKWNITRTEFLRICLDPTAPASARSTVAAILRMFELREGSCITANYELVRLRQLDFYQVEGLTDMSPLRGLSTLEALDLTGQKVQDIEFLRTLPGLKTLVLDGNPLEDLTPLLNLPFLRDLSLQNSEVQNISLFSSLRRLKRLNVDGNRIKDFSALTEQERRGLQILGKQSQQP